jgi:diaminopimelate epimerase
MNSDFLVSITKMSGSGNDFILVNNFSKAIPETEMIALTRGLCRRRVSIGADGMIFIGPSERYDFKWRFFNADGSEAEMCGNGGRCAARFALLQGIAGPEMTFETLAGPIRARVEGAQIKIQLTSPKDIKLDQPITVGQEVMPADFINTGVPHTTIWVEDIEAADLAGLGPLIRFHEVFQPAGANVNFAQLKEPGMLMVRTYERGIEAETLACGTGSVAVAALAFLKNRVVSPVQVLTRGGEILKVHIEGRPGKDIEKVFLEGKVRLVFRGEVFREALSS